MNALAEAMARIKAADDEAVRSQAAFIRGPSVFAEYMEQKMAAVRERLENDPIFQTLPRPQSDGGNGRESVGNAPRIDGGSGSGGTSESSEGIASGGAESGR